ncbi:hypothetical protein RFM26_00695 [Mesorhizobium sp. VK23B]|uniref:Uncharacterized protein n=1 Tax=Mesorhizobium dulcispinae TaxID=3072316 RepID=A0ABU4X710_9HYPH|nr:MULTISPECIES: hypothetical protein [unclassified Mesorhizobium]MDX8464211.1 hypothetical protein [Mesorhizobium sp. VK23B]MDX8470597.1 hypothetical protein [Mesorhizobium sp. VK23A]
MSAFESSETRTTDTRMGGVFFDGLPGTTFSVLDVAGEASSRNRSKGVIDPSRLYVVEDDGQAVQRTKTALFLADCSEAFFQLQKVARTLDEGTEFEADLLFMDAKKSVFSLAKHRDLGEGIALVIWWLIKIAASSPVAPEAQNHIQCMKAAISDLKKSPNLDFERAMAIVDELETSLGAHPAPSINELASLLLDGENVEQSATE